MSVYMTTDSLGTALFCAASPAMAACRGTDMYRAEGAAVTARHGRFADRTRVLGLRNIPVNVDLPFLKQPPIRVPQPPRERNP
ncbi:hypothetical protein [Amycolatopsis taiwanensis]|uniref:Uncharacterized protein n=1 Tax=Amycolatopsis taiwanensis TaxID=342230 RepID=A0A9W6R7Z0_9PSEU|nr:hypothetical protein [Amycolatopsis taiwanensis]GLY71036.1 hypothetical protein Atai01_76550 [Amycolatopsis taiwanensis]